ncbi:MAG: sialate O-acetylesterase, partial [Lentisphaeria bacterium]|nr:sialate O-acetylesterase [Lentisphaeria bacterium]
LYQEGGSYWSEVREQQRIVRDTMKNSYMATAIDAGEELDIHPQDKKTVGDRLAANALNRVYHFDCVPEGPVYTSYTVEGDAIRVSFRNVGKIVLKENAVRSFFVAEELTHEFFPADSVTIDSDNSLLIRCHAVKLPAAVRYAWSTNPDCTVYNDAGFPASPFRTDSW